VAQKLNIYVSSDSKLSIKNSNLLLQKSDDIINIPIDIISSIVVDSYHSYFSQNLLSCLSRQGITLIVIW
jgi:CRISPR-associated protein Cas1